MVHRGSIAASEASAQDGGSIAVVSMVESIVGCKWSMKILGLLAAGISRPSALLRSCPGLSAKVMNERMRKMMQFDIVRRTVLGEKPPVQVKYTLTPFGRRFMRILDEVNRLQQAVHNGAIVDSGRIQKGAVRSSRLTRR